MRKNPLIGKYYAIVCVLLFVSLSFTPVINAYQPTKEISSDRMSKGDVVRIIVSEHRADGSIRKIPVSLPRDEFNKMQNELRGTKTIDDKLSVYKKHGLIPQNVTDETLQRGMMVRARALGFSDSKKLVLSDNFLGEHGFIMGFNCGVYGYFDMGFKLLFGSSFFAQLINSIIFQLELDYLGIPYIPSVDLLDINMGILVEISKYGLWNRTVGEFFGLSVMAGFVGYFLSCYPTLFISSSDEFIGYAVFIFGFAFGDFYWNPSPGNT